MVTRLYRNIHKNKHCNKKIFGSRIDNKDDKKINFKNKSNMGSSNNTEMIKKAYQLNFEKPQ